MSADIVNLRRARKQKARTDKATQAERNRTIHGERKSDRTLRDTLHERATTQLDQHRRESASHDSDDPE